MATTIDKGIYKKFQVTRKEMGEGLIERDAEIEAVLTALLAHEHVLLVGPPGTAKSLLLDTVMQWLHGRRFSILLTKHTAPEEVFGPVSLTQLKQDKYVRVTTGKLPEAEGAFIDEVFKGSSAILNTLLQVMNERKFSNGNGAPVPVPLKILVGASNEWPQSQEGGKELGAMFDRFLIRKTVRPVAGARGKARLLWEDDHTPQLSTSLTAQELEQAHQDAMGLPVSDAAKVATESILQEIAKEGVLPGDRRKKKAIKVAKAAAYLDGSDEVLPEHLEVLAHVLWDDPAEQPEKVAKVVAKVANPIGMKLNELLMEIEQVTASVKPGELSSAVAACGKLQEIGKRLGQLPKSNTKVKTAQDHLKDQIKQLKLTAFDEQL